MKQFPIPIDTVMESCSLLPIQLDARPGMVFNKGMNQGQCQSFGVSPRKERICMTEPAALLKGLNVYVLQKITRSLHDSMASLLMAPKAYSITF